MVQTAQRERICYAAAHTVVLFDCQERRQTLLQGHRNAVTCLCTTNDRTVVASADRGPSSLVVLWDVHSAAPIRTLPAPHADGVQVQCITVLATAHKGCMGMSSLPLGDPCMCCVQMLYAARAWHDS